MNIGIVIAIAKGMAYFKQCTDFMDDLQSWHCNTVSSKEETVTQSILCTGLALSMPFWILHGTKSWGDLSLSQDAEKAYSS